MRIYVTVKQVPDTSGTVAVHEDGTLDRASMQTIINPDDLAAMEQALRIKDATGCQVTAITMGPPPAEGMLRELIAMGADDAILVSGREFGGSDTFATSQILGAAIVHAQAGDNDFMIFSGRQAIDGDTAQVGPQIAENLGVPQISYAEGIEINGDVVTVKRQYEDRYHIIEVGMPCLLTAIQELAEPRYMHAGLIVDAYNTEIPVIDFAALESRIDKTTIGNAGSPTNVVRSFTKQPKGQGIKYDNVGPDEAVKIIMDKMIERHII